MASKTLNMSMTFAQCKAANMNEITINAAAELHISFPAKETLFSSNSSIISMCYQSFIRAESFPSIAIWYISPKLYSLWKCSLHSRRVFPLKDLPSYIPKSVRCVGIPLLNESLTRIVFKVLLHAPKRSLRDFMDILVLFGHPKHFKGSAMLFSDPLVRLNEPSLGESVCHADVNPIGKEVFSQLKHSPNGVFSPLRAPAVLAVLVLEHVILKDNAVEVLLSPSGLAKPRRCSNYT